MPVPPDLTDRLILTLVNECVACARERIVEDIDLVDAGVIFGTGFAPFAEVDCLCEDAGHPVLRGTAAGARTALWRPLSRRCGLVKPGLTAG